MQLKGASMKTLALTLATLISMSAFAIENSQLEERHQETIKKAVIEKCSFRRAKFIEIKSEATPIRVDQGILDFNYVTKLKVEDRIDQGIKDDYLVTIESHYYDSYDHDEKDWGIYRVSSVQCELI